MATFTENDAVTDEGISKYAVGLNLNLVPNYTVLYNDAVSDLAVLTNNGALDLRVCSEDASSADHGVVRDRRGYLPLDI